MGISTTLLLVGAALAAPITLAVISVWLALGLLLSLTDTTAAAISVLVTWSWYFKHADELFVQMPAVVSAWLALSLLVPKSGLLHLSVWVVLTEYVISRAHWMNIERKTASGSEDSDTAATAAYWFVALACVLPAWTSVCRLKLWRPANDQLLLDAEEQLYRKFLAPGSFDMTKVAGLGTVHVPYSGDTIPGQTPTTLVLVHGYLAGNGFWAANLAGLAKSFDVYAVEWMGIGRSVRQAFNPKNAEEADAFFVEPLEHWRRELKLDRIVLCGHSMGGLYSTYYAKKYPDAVEHLVLLSPAGVNRSALEHHELPLARRIAYHFYWTPMTLIRAMGPLGPRLVRWMVTNRLNRSPPSNAIRTGAISIDQFALYCYHNWALAASGDIALHTHLHPGASARGIAVSDIIDPTTWSAPVTFLYGGGDDWMDKEPGKAVVARLRATNNHYAALGLVPLSGHQVFMDNPVEFDRVLAQSIKEFQAFQAAHKASTDALQTAVASE